MDALALIQQIESQRERWLVLAEAGDGQPELAVLLRRPPEVDWPELLGASVRRRAEVAKAAVIAGAVNWRGFTEATLLGASVGANQPLPFDARVWAVVVVDRMDWIDLAYRRLLEQVTEQAAARGAAAKNSKPSSTPKPAAGSRTAKRARGQ